MKILNLIDKARQSLQVKPEDFLGKDVWVRCCRTDIRKYGAKSGVPGYVKINRKVDDDAFRCNFISEAELEKVSEMSPEDSSLLVTRECTIPARRIVIYEPIRTLPKRKLPKVIDSSDESTIDKFIGKDFWVKVQFTRNHVPQRPQYARFLRKDGYYIEYNCVDAGCIEYHNTIFSDAEYLTEQLHYAHVSGIILCTPIELYTTEELMYELSLCNNREDEDDEDEDEYYDDEDEYYDEDEEDDEEY